MRACRRLPGGSPALAEWPRLFRAPSHDTQTLTQPLTQTERPDLMALPPPRRRCAVYTRKSSEEGLEQAFNSLDAQRDAGVAYIQSQAHEGWQLVETAYDDGGYSGPRWSGPRCNSCLPIFGRSVFRSWWSIKLIASRAR